MLQVNFVRKFYENLVPTCTLYDIDCPDISFRKFTEDGKYLISFSRNHPELIVCRPSWLSFSCKCKDSDYCALPPKAQRFDSFFTQLYTISLGATNELICKDFFLYLESQEFGLFATSTAHTHDAPISHGAVSGVPSIERITFYLVRLEDGIVLDEKVFCNDFINLAHSMGVFLYDDLLCILSLRYQAIHILQVLDSGHLVDVPEGSSFLSGIKQRLLSYIFRKHWNEEADPTLVQFLDRHHLLIKFGSVDGGVSRSTDQHPSFFAVYNMETTEIITFYQNSAEELYYLFEQFYDHFHVSSRTSLHAKFTSSHSNNIHVLDQLWLSKNKASSFSQLISAADRHRHSTEHPIKFISRRQPNILKFKIKLGPEEGSSDAHAKRISSFLFHPYLPLAMSIQQTFMQPTVVNIHFRR
ncbi:Light-mediated development protein DET1 [Apostasia shenzhenica]|uniref:Light-mediated development protein DET1 n=1 Tax=Apostasia shenzhenica TaxID=1088818 RepID=A0A2I0A3S2_9ASPA|nr:Light-mediated development protein DET1 [Apostasia shenzhenica]